MLPGKEYKGEVYGSPPFVSVVDKGDKPYVPVYRLGAGGRFLSLVRFEESDVYKRKTREGSRVVRGQ